MDALPLEGADVEFIANAREDISKALRGEDDRLIILLGPDCIHDKHGAMAYANMLLKAKEEFAKELLLVMQVDFETPRKSTSAAWKGLINDPHIKGEAKINEGLMMARELLIAITRLGLPVSMEYLDTIVPQFLGDIVSVSMFSGRISESQVHRELASGLSSPVGFANGTDGSIQQAIDACNAATHPHSFLSVTKQGLAAIVHTNGNPDYFVMLTGGENGPNFSLEKITEAEKGLQKAGLWAAVGVDCAHNADDDLDRQCQIIGEVAASVAQGALVKVVLMESYLQRGAQEVRSDKKPSGSLSLTSPCLDWSTTEDLLSELANAVRARRAKCSPPAKKQRR
eukprot:GGOE01041653.1.p1 GENE.GGOE01041653.1~~GGOE01041653.1.p1  ORF type:complete len:370 (-),score=57.61 GGOE01041653.1:276-1298(-)